MILAWVFVSIVAFYGLGLTFSYQKRARHSSRRRISPVRTMIVLGSGGHSTEMIEIVEKMHPERYSPRCYVLARGDTRSARATEHMEEERGARDFSIVEIKRSRKLHQSFLTSIFSTIWATCESIPLLVTFRPELVLCNGPGTCVPICLLAFFLDGLWPWREPVRIVFIESFCRVKSISLTGRILTYFTDLFVVQWPGLASHRAKYLGRLF
ncbi:UDP-N-acetylglucosamine transferase subunit ALG14 homolog [Lutzomyia longipalpis]|uniref:UDP-N-acetylglucosamine transferase subunit ALG14 homolog n=1 Tax=Lutzomyia longipalpis TaxID=7200 RepID=UPI00248424C3|nr:UDP-N-acetylglucosamine transferase subunit ALG14 homolog [Lutzomyia longipalpis]